VFDHEFAYLPSASTLGVIRLESPLRSHADRIIAVFADPVYDLTDIRAPKTQNTASTTPPEEITKMATSASLNTTLVRSGAALQRLPSTAKEAKAIIDLVPDPKLRMVKTGMEATLDAALNKDLRRFKYVHFATHTRLIDDHPELSSLMLSLVDERGNHRNGSLRLHDIYNLRLSADLVVLSACETAIGKQIKGEGLMSMVRGFMYSGTPRVLASLWKVDDDGTAELMTEFYSQLLKFNSTPSKALQQAQIKLIGRKTRISHSTGRPSSSRANGTE
jgi:CHAT domain-containing protein